MCKTRHSQTTTNKAKPPANNYVHANKTNYIIFKAIHVIAISPRHKNRILAQAGFLRQESLMQRQRL